ncbi:hypothetical protein Dimus_011059 [Dionaea muscipula]
MMHMTFYWGTKVTMLFDFWKTETWADYSLTLVACFLFSFFYQYLELRRIQFKHLPTSVSALASGTVASSALEAPLIVRPLKLAAVVGRSGCPSAIWCLDRRHHWSKMSPLPLIIHALVLNLSNPIQSNHVLALPCCTCSAPQARKEDDRRRVGLSSGGSFVASSSRDHGSGEGDREQIGSTA